MHKLATLAIAVLAIAAPAPALAASGPGFTQAANRAAQAFMRTWAAPAKPRRAFALGCTIVVREVQAVCSIEFTEFSDYPGQQVIASGIRVTREKDDTIVTDPWYAPWTVVLIR